MAAPGRNYNDVVTRFWSLAAPLYDLPFLQQWVYRADMPSYRLEYHFEPRPEGGVLLLGTLFQDGVPDNWVMPLPMLMDFGGGKVARGTVCARGPKTEIKIGLPSEPKQALLDPDLWVLSNNSSQSKTKH